MRQARQRECQAPCQFRFCSFWGAVTVKAVRDVDIRRSPLANDGRHCVPIFRNQSPGLVFFLLALFSGCGIVQAAHALIGEGPGDRVPGSVASGEIRVPGDTPSGRCPLFFCFQQPVFDLQSTQLLPGIASSGVRFSFLY